MAQRGLAVVSELLSKGYEHIKPTWLDRLLNASHADVMVLHHRINDLERLIEMLTKRIVDLEKQR